MPQQETGTAIRVNSVRSERTASTHARRDCKVEGSRAVEAPLRRTLIYTLSSIAAVCELQSVELTWVRMRISQYGHR